MTHNITLLYLMPKVINYSKKKMVNLSINFRLVLKKKKLFKFAFIISLIKKIDILFTCNMRLGKKKTDLKMTKNITQKLWENLLMEWLILKNPTLMMKSWSKFGKL